MSIIFILALSHVLIDRSVKKECKSLNGMPLTVPIAEWLERYVYAGMQGVVGAIPGGGTYFHFEFCAYLPLLTALRRPFK